MNKRFWMVWSPKGGLSKKYLAMAEAIEEAKEVAQKHLGVVFVLEAVTTVETRAEIITDVKPMSVGEAP